MPLVGHPLIGTPFIGTPFIGTPCVRTPLYRYPPSPVAHPHRYPHPLSPPIDTPSSTHLLYLAPLQECPWRWTRPVSNFDRPIWVSRSHRSKKNKSRYVMFPSACRYHRPLSATHLLSLSVPDLRGCLCFWLALVPSVRSLLNSRPVTYSGVNADLESSIPLSLLLLLCP